MCVMLAYLLRHGDAADLAPDGSYDDDRRELTETGQEKLANACVSYGQIMAPPERILSSSLVRAIQSAKILAAACDFDGDIEVNDILLPGANPAAAVDLLQGEILTGTQSIALVGHQPHMGDLLGMLVTGNERMSLPMKKGMLAGIELHDPQVVQGRLVCMLAQKAGRALSK